MYYKLIRTVSFPSHRYFSAHSNWTPQEVRIPVPWGHIAGTKLDIFWESFLDCFIHKSIDLFPLSRRVKRSKCIAFYFKTVWTLSTYSRLSKRFSDICAKRHFRERNFREWHFRERHFRERHFRERHFREVPGMSHLWLIPGTSRRGRD
jgi:hypothetical protein